ncbi:MAG: O-antigen ligase family protein, partial [Desulfobacula sp.]|nr:O-antigen ligase family protein [Desulfobacula sp.]
LYIYGVSLLYFANLIIGNQKKISNDTKKMMLIYILFIFYISVLDLIGQNFDFRMLRDCYVVLIILVLISSHQKQKDIDALIKFLFFSTIIACIFGLLQTTGQKIFYPGYYLGLSKDAEDYGIIDALNRGRIFGLDSHDISFGFTLSLTTPLLFANYYLLSKKKIFRVVILLTIIFTIFFTFNRSLMAAFSITIILLLIKFKQNKKTILVLALVSCALFLSQHIVLPELQKERFALQDDSALYRKTLYKGVYITAKKNFLLGINYKNKDFQSYASSLTGLSIYHNPHNAIVEIIINYGIFAFSLIMIIIFQAIKNYYFVYKLFSQNPTTYKYSLYSFSCILCILCFCLVAFFHNVEIYRSPLLWFIIAFSNAMKGNALDFSKNGQSSKALAL